MVRYVTFSAFCRVKISTRAYIMFMDLLGSLESSSGLASKGLSGVGLGF